MIGKNQNQKNNFLAAIYDYGLWSLFIWFISHASFQFELHDVFGTSGQVSCTFVFFFSKETGCIFWKPDLLTLKCYNVK